MNLLAGFSALVSGRCVKAFGAINTMVFTHFPSNVFLMLVALMPNCEWAVIMLLIRFAISQMDVPAREAYVNNVVESDEKPAANGITMLVRGVGVACAPVIVGYLSENPNSFAFTLPFIISGALKCCYDVILYIVFQMTPPKAAPSTTSTTGSARPDAAAPSVNAPNADADEHTPLVHAPNGPRGSDHVAVPVAAAAAPATTVEAVGTEQKTNELAASRKSTSSAEPVAPATTAAAATAPAPRKVSAATTGTADTAAAPSGTENIGRKSSQHK